MKNKLIKIEKLIILGLILGLSFISINIFNHLNVKLDNNNQYLRENLKSADYSSGVEGSGEDINITLHQSYLNNSFNKALNTSDSNNNKFLLPCPTDIMFNSSYVNITVDNIYAPNKTITIEDQLASFQSIDYQVAATSFEVHVKSYLVNLSTYVYIDDNENNKCDLVARVLNSTWVNGINEPDDDIAIICSGGQMSFAHFEGWLNNYSDFFNPILLDPSKTANDTFYIELRDNGLDSDGMLWRMGVDNPPTNPDDSLSYELLGVNWTLIKIGSYTTYDLNLKVELSPVENIPKPEDIGLKINNTAVIGDNNIPGFGYWNSTQNYSSSTGQLEFEITADWWDVSCDITKVQINYTKTDLKASSSFRVLGSEQDDLWNVSRTGGLNYFDPRLSDYKTNFTIPSSWNNINVFNGSINKTDDCIIHSDKNGYKIIEVNNAGNGTYWHLTATSENLLESIDTYIDTNPVDVLNYTDIVHFNASFKEKIAQGNGIINLSVYSPAALNDKLNFTSTNSTFESGSEFYLGKWDISDTITGYGEFRVQVFWNNDTAAGFIEKTLTIMGQTELNLITPEQEAIFRSDKTFNIIVYYEDINLNTAINGATIDYNI
ncbi:MAG: hypothetical protein ACFE9X_03685, partial [Promethearchaeota archaeon]